MHYLGRLKLVAAVFAIVGGLYYYADLPDAAAGPRVYFPAVAEAAAAAQAAAREAAAHDDGEDTEAVAPDGPVEAESADNGAAAVG